MTTQEQELMELFKVEELEERLEMAKCTAAVSASSNGTVTGRIGAKF